MARAYAANGGSLSLAEWSCSTCTDALLSRRPLGAQQPGGLPRGQSLDSQMVGLYGVVTCY